MGYALPSGSTRVTSSFNDHKNRNPPSTQPGTDYGVNLGSSCYAPSDGKVTSVRTNTGPTTDGQGRYVSIKFDDGREARALHMERVDVSVGQRVSRGQKIGLTGASGYGSNYYYGPHVHQTLWKGVAFSTDEIDFELYVGGTSPAPKKERSEMFVTKYGGSQYRLIAGDRIVDISETAAMTMRESGVPYGALPNADVEHLQEVLVSEKSSGGTGGGAAVPMTFEGTITPVQTLAVAVEKEADCG